MTASNDLTVTLGTLSGTNNVTVSGGDATGDGTINLTGGTFALSGTGNFGGATTWTFNNLTFSSGTQTATGTGGINVSGVLTLSTSGALHAGSKTWTLSGTTGTPFATLGLGASFTADTSTVVYSGNNTGGNTTVRSVTYNNLTTNNGSETYVTNATQNVSNDLTITAGTFDVTASNFALNIGGSYSNSGTFTANSGTVTFNATSSGKTLSGTMTGSSKFYNLTFNGVGGAWSFGSNAGEVANNLTITNGTVTAPSATLTITNNYTNNATFTHNSGTVTFNATATGKTLSGTLDSSSGFYNLIFNGSGGGWTFGAAVAVANDFTVTNGAATAGNNNLTVTRDFTLANTSGVAYNPGSSTVTVSRHYTDSGQKFAKDTSTVIADGTGTFTTGTNAFFNNLSFGYSGKTTTLVSNPNFVVFGVLTFNGGSVDGTAQTYVDVYRDTTGTSIVFTAPTTITGGTLFTVLNAGAGMTQTIPGADYGSWTIYLSGRADNTVFQLGGDVSNTALFDVNATDGLVGTTFNTQNHNLTTTNDFALGYTPGSTGSVAVNLGSSTISSAGFDVITDGGSHTLDMGSAQVTASGNVRFVDGTGAITVTPGTSTLTMTPGAALTKSYTSNAQHLYNFTINGNATGTVTLGAAALVDNDLTITAGTLDVTASNYALTVGSNWNNAGGTFNSRASTVTFTATSTGKTLAGTLNSTSAFYNLTFNGSGGGWSNSSSMTVSNNLTVTLGTLSGTNNITVDGDATGAGTITLTGGTFEMDPGGSKNFGTTSGSNDWTFRDLKFGGATSGSVTTQTGGSGGVIVSNILTLNGSSTSCTADEVSLDAGNRIWTLGGTTGTPFVYGGCGVFTANTSTFAYTGNNSGGNTTINHRATYYNLTVNNGSETFVPSGNMTISNDLAVTSGTLSGTNNITVSGGDATGDGTINLTAGTLTMTGTGNFGGATAWTFNNLTIGTGATQAVTAATGSGGITVSSILTISQKIGGGGNQLSAGTKTWTLAGGSSCPFFSCANSTLIGATFVAETSTFTYTGNNGAGNVGVANKTFYNLIVNNGSETFNLGLGTAATNDLTITSGTLDATASNYNFALGRNYSNSGTFTARNATFTLNGSSQQTLSGTITGSSAFYDLTISNASGTADPGCGTSFTPSVIFSTAATATNNFTITTASVKVQYNSGSTYSFNNINWNGQAAGTRIQFRNSNLSSGTWLLNVTAIGNAQTKVSYVDVGRSDASSGATIIASDGTNTDCGNNINWQFDETLTLSLDSTSKAFGTISPGATPSDQTSILTASSNAANGFIIYAWATQPMTNVRFGGVTLPDWTGTNAVPTSWTAGNYGFGYTTDDNDLTGTGGATRFSAGTLFAAFTNSGPGDPVADRTAPATGVTNNVSYRLYPSTTQANGDYSTTVVYVITAQFP